MKTTRLPMAAVWAPTDTDVQPKKITALVKSIKEIGLRIPISVRRKWDKAQERNYEIVAGRHRFQAMRRIGADSIPCVIEPGTETDAELWQCSENLHRTNMSPRAEALATQRWRELCEKKHKENSVSVQNAPKLKKLSKRGRKGEGAPEKSGSIGETAKALGVDKAEIIRRQKIASMDGKAAAVLEALPESIKATQADFLHVAQQPKEQQVEAAEALAERKEREQAERKTNGRPPKANPIVKAWNAASDDDRRAFVAENADDLKEMVEELF